VCKDELDGISKWDGNRHQSISNYKSKYFCFTPRCRIIKVRSKSEQFFFSLKKKPKSLSIGQQQTKAHPHNILIVDDEPDALFTYKTFLASEGFNVDAFTLPEEALKMCATKNKQEAVAVLYTTQKQSLHYLNAIVRIYISSIS
jgi:PleD family two-component response regulator